MMRNGKHKKEMLMMHESGKTPMGQHDKGEPKVAKKKKSPKPSDVRHRIAAGKKVMGYGKY